MPHRVGGGVEAGSHGDVSSVASWSSGRRRRCLPAMRAHGAFGLRVI